ncbi:MAG: hypothetical protein MK198_14720 [Gracilimonas sp.]|uniref:hypothetical protein n=1 Tax=Gracilimonas sp. TaxID=1974203 RepID=UPI0037532270|nr:hypothetical protein [Gracilimonas sp.]
MEIIKANPDIPLFVLHEINKDPNRSQNFMLDQIAAKVQPFMDQIKEEREKENTVDLPAEQILVNNMSLVIFPFFIGRAVFKTILEKNKDDYDAFIEERQRLLPDYIVSIVMNK